MCNYNLIWKSTTKDYMGARNDKSVTARRLFEIGRRYFLPNLILISLRNKLNCYAYSVYGDGLSFMYGRM